MSYRFKEARLQAGFTTVQLAQKMGVTQAAVSHWDAGKKVPGTETLCKRPQKILCNRRNVTV